MEGMLEKEWVGLEKGRRPRIAVGDPAWKMGPQNEGQQIEELRTGFFTRAVG